MPAPLRVALAVVTWLVTVTLLHLGLNTDVLNLSRRGQGPDVRKFRVGFLPVT